MLRGYKIPNKRIKVERYLYLSEEHFIYSADGDNIFAALSLDSIDSEIIVAIMFV